MLMSRIPNKQSINEYFVKYLFNDAWRFCKINFHDNFVSVIVMSVKVTSTDFLSVQNNGFFLADPMMISYLRSTMIQLQVSKIMLEPPPPSPLLLLALTAIARLLPAATIYCTLLNQLIKQSRPHAVSILIFSFGQSAKKFGK